MSKINEAKNWFLDFVSNNKKAKNMFQILRNSQRGDWVSMNPDEAAIILTEYAAHLKEQSK